MVLCFGSKLLISRFKKPYRLFGKTYRRSHFNAYQFLLSASVLTILVLLVSKIDWITLKFWEVCISASTLLISKKISHDFWWSLSFCASNSYNNSICGGSIYPWIFKFDFFSDIIQLLLFSFQPRQKFYHPFLQLYTLRWDSKFTVLFNWFKFPNPFWHRSAHEASTNSNKWAQIVFVAAFIGFSLVTEIPIIKGRKIVIHLIGLLCKLGISFVQPQ